MRLSMHLYNRKTPPTLNTSMGPSKRVTISRSKQNSEIWSMSPTVPPKVDNIDHQTSHK